MKIYSMTATFGKLNHQTLTLKPGLNIIEAPNEWGKSTWSAFILAMLYGIDTSSRSKKDFIADKERFAPWSGLPMSGRMDISWNGRDITIERSSKGRSIFGVFKAYETESGMEVPELTAANCGEKLLGVEQSVFARAGFIRLKDMPVTQDESLRRRLNSLVTTGDESGSADDLAQKLKDLKNKCRFNRSGLLPQAEAQQRELNLKLEELDSLQRQVDLTQRRQEELKVHQEKLLNHKQALQYEADRNFAGKLAMAKAQLEIAGERAEALESVCQSLPNPKMLELKKLQLQQLQEKKEALQMEIQLQPPAPQLPDSPPQFRGVNPAMAVSRAEADAAEFARLMDGQKKLNPAVLAVLLVGFLACVVMFALKRSIPCLLLAVFCIPVWAVLQVLRRNKNKSLENQARMLAHRYAPIEPENWAAEAKLYADAQEDYETNLNDYRNKLGQLDMRLKAILSQLDAMTGGQSPSRYEQETDAALGQHRSFADALRERGRLQEMVATLESSHRQIAPPEHPDTLTFTMPETERMLSDAAVEAKQLHLRLGQYLGRMEALGSADTLKLQLEKVNLRIAELEKVYNAAVLGLETLLAAKQELQRRFAPRISQRAQELFGQLTHGRYQRLALDQELSVSAAAEGEDTLRGSLWRSDGTADQLYLALRLAVAGELTPEAPLVLDDAFVRFDDDRLKEALNILNQSGKDKQVILFTCQSREQKILEELS